MRDFLFTLKYILVCFSFTKVTSLVAIATLYFLGAFIHNEYGIFERFFELSFDKDFRWPLHRNIVDCVNALAVRKTLLQNCTILNSYNYSFLTNLKEKCTVPDNFTIKLVLIIKSAVGNFDRRSAIRKTWGSEERFRHIGLKCIFLLGITTNKTAQSMVSKEQEQYGDIVQADFLDTYRNLTIKTMIGFKWAYEYCNAKFYLFSDDDMYVSIKNILRFLRNPTEYPEYLQRVSDNASKYHDDVADFDTPDGVNLLYGPIPSLIPFRNVFCKWFLSLDDYPYDKLPVYVAGCSYIVSREILVQILYGSYFTKFFWIDDVFLGIIAKKLNLKISNGYHMKSQIEKITNYTISKHNYNPKGLIKEWNKQMDLGNA